MGARLPASASVATPLDGDALHAPAAARNGAALSDLLLHHAPQRGQALEIASGTGQHVTAFARAMPQMHWHPTEIDPTRRASIDAHVRANGLGNVSPARALDACARGWGAKEPPKDLILLVNLLHLIPVADVKVLLHELAQALTEGGTAILYGPFKRTGMLTSEGDIRFDAQLRGADPLIGYKDDVELQDWLSDAGLRHDDTIEMPANNLAFIARKPVP